MGYLSNNNLNDDFNSPSPQPAAGTGTAGAGAAGAGMAFGPWGAAAMAGYQIISSMQQAEILRQNAEISKEINEMNAQYAEMDAWEAEKTGLEQEARYQTTIDQTAGAQKVALAAQDMDINFGTAKELQNESKLAGFLNHLDIRNQAHAQALGLKNQARNIRLTGRAESASANLQASAIQNAGLMRGLETGVNATEKYGYGGASGYSKNSAARVKSGL